MFKKLIIILLLSSALYAEGFYSAGSFSFDETKVKAGIPDGQYFTTAVIIGAEWNGLYAESETITDMVKGDKHVFSPYNTEYYARAGYSFKNVYVEYEHLCIHGVDRHNPQGGHDRFTIGFDTRYD